VGGIGQARLRRGSAVAATELEALYLAGAGVGTIFVGTEEIAAAVRALNPLVVAVVDPHQVIEVSKLHATQDAAERALAQLKELLAL
jgi:hypothetical protein